MVAGFNRALGLWNDGFRASAWYYLQVDRLAIVARLEITIIEVVDVTASPKGGDAAALESDVTTTVVADRPAAVEASSVLDWPVKLKLVVSHYGARAAFDIKEGSVGEGHVRTPRAFRKL